MPPSTPLLAKLAERLSGGDEQPQNGDRSQASPDMVDTRDKPLVTSHAAFQAGTDCL